jgi:hypothetical protein
VRSLAVFIAMDSTAPCNITKEDVQPRPSLPLAHKKAVPIKSSRQKLELCRAHTPCVRLANLELHVCVQRSLCWYCNSASNSWAYLHFNNSRLCAWAESLHAACIMYLSRLPVDRRGYDGQQKALFVTLMDSVPRFEAHWSQFSPNSIDSSCLCRSGA